MGYELHITRAEFWAENEGYEISAEEWLDLISKDPELKLDPQNGPHFAAWSPPGDATEAGWLDWFEGNLASKYPGRLLFGKMLEVARKLGAKVQGDDGEIYTTLQDYPE